MFKCTITILWTLYDLFTSADSTSLSLSLCLSIFLCVALTRTYTYFGCLCIQHKIGIRFTCYFVSLNSKQRSTVAATAATATTSVANPKPIHSTMSYLLWPAECQGCGVRVCVCVSSILWFCLPPFAPMPFITQRMHTASPPIRDNSWLFKFHTIDWPTNLY